MENDQVLCIDVTATSTCIPHTKSWNQVLQELHSAPIQVIFGSTQSFINAQKELQDSLVDQLKIPSFFFDRIYLQANGFSGHDVGLGQDGELKWYSSWSRFTVKQTYDGLAPKRTFIPHLSRHLSIPQDSNADIAIHGPQSIQYGWEWYEMGFLTHRNQAGQTILLCFDVPTRLHSEIESLLGSQRVDFSCPYTAFSIVTNTVLRLYDDSVWSIRNHISRWEARRSQETDYVVLHEIARHGLHVKETLTVAARSLGAICEHQQIFYKNTESIKGSKSHRHWNKSGRKLQFQHYFLQGLLDRSEANNTRIQNEISLAFNVAAQRDSKIQVRIGHEAKTEASAMKAIAIVTMAFLPATFVSTLFGTNFFSMQSEDTNPHALLTVSRQFWVFWAISVPLTIVTLSLWLWWSSWVKPRYHM